jgi:probable phosphoglycerate mutase
VAKRIAAMGRVDAIYSSPLQRALQTAQPIAARFGLPMQPLAGIIDIHYGAWQGLSPEEAATKYPRLYRLWLTQPQRAHIPGGETLPQVRRRAMAALRKVVAGHGGATIVLVSHLVVCRLLLLGVLGLPTGRFWRIAQETGTINVFEHDENGFSIVALNDAGHLRGILPQA